MLNPETEPISKRKVSRLRGAWLWIELVFLYLLMPMVVAGLVRPERGDAVLHRVSIDGLSFETGLPSGAFIFPVLLLTFVSMYFFLKLDPDFDNRRLWDWVSFKVSIRRILIGFAVAGPIILITTWVLAYHTTLLDKQGLFYLPREIPLLMLAIIVFYPWISAYPQEVTHRAFFFHRYEPILGSGRTIFILNVIAFSWLHVPMWNGVALLMTIPAGILFAWTYRRTQSALAAGFEHAIYGIWVFATGLGYFVYAGR